MDSQTVTRPVPVVQAEFRAIGTTNRILATDLTVLTEATAIAREHLDALDLAVSRFRPDSEAVSYTHLDVYKRQSACKICNERSLPCATATTSEKDGAYALSLIHI